MIITEERSRGELKRCQNGDRQAFRHLYQDYHLKVRSTLYSLCGSLSLDDLEQEVFLRVWKGLPKLRNLDQFATWLYRITWNVATDQRRTLAQQREQQTQESLLLREESSPSPWTNLHYQTLIHQGLQALDWDHRSIVVLHDLEDIPQKEIASILNIPLGTVKSRLFNGRKQLKQFLNQEGGVFL